MSNSLKVSERFGKLASAAVVLFAVVGFVASIVTIASYFNGATEASLGLRVTPNEFRIPEYVAGQLREEMPSRKIAEKLKDALCKDVKASLVVARSDDEISSLGFDADMLSKSLRCRDAARIEFVTRWSASYLDSPGSLFNYEITNNGSRVAENVRLEASKVNAAQVLRGGNYVDLKKEEGGQYYLLPDLNPSERLDLVVWGYSTLTPYWSSADIPEITYAGSVIEAEYMKSVPDGWSNLYEMFGEDPWYIQAFLLVALSFVIVIFIVFAFSFIATVASGRPLSSMFKTDGDAKQGGD